MGKNSSFVKGEKYRQKKREVKELTNQKSELIQKLTESNRELEEVKKELDNLLSIFDNVNGSKEDAEKLLRKAKNSIKNIETLEGNIKELETIAQNYYSYSQREIKTLGEKNEGFLRLTNNPNQQKKRIIQTKDNEINGLYANEIAWEIEKVNWEQQLKQVNQQNQAIQQQLAQTQQENKNLQTSLNTRITEYNLLQGQLEETSKQADYWHEKADHLCQSIQILQRKLNELETILWCHQNYYTNSQQEIANLRNNLEEKKEKSRQLLKAAQSQFRQQINQELQTQLNDLQIQNTNLITTVNNYLKIIVDLEREKNALEAERNELVQGDNFQTDFEEQRKYYRENRSKRGRSIEWRDSQITLVGDEDNQDQGTSTNPKNPDNQINNSNWKSTFWQKTKKIGLTALISYVSYQTGHYQGANSSHQLQLNCPTSPTTNYPVFANSTHSWQESPLNNPYVIHQSPTNFCKNKQEAEKAEHQHLVDPATYRTNWINPVDLEAKAQEKGMVSLEIYNLRPNITLDEYQQLLKNRKPINLPKDWEIKLTQLSELEKRPNISPEEFAKYKSPEQIKEIEKSIRETVEKEFAGFINPKNPKTLKEYKLFTESQLDEAIKNKAKQKDKGLINPSNSTALTEHKLFTEDQIKKEVENKKQALANVENFNQQLDNVQQELVRTKRKKRKLARKYQQEQTQHTKTQTKFQAQSNYLQNIFECLVSAGMGAKLGWKCGRMYEKGELEAKYLKDIRNVINTLIQQKNQAQKNQERTEKERDQAQSERDNYRWQMENHECASVSNTSQERIIQKQIETIRENNEQEIIRELNVTLHLGLENPTLKQVISKIQELIVKDPKTVDAPFGEDLEVIKRIDLVGLEQELNIILSPQVKEQIKKATNYQELSFLRNKEIKSYLEKGQNNTEITTLPNQQTIRPFEKERIFWLILLGMSLLIIGGLLAKTKGLSQKKKKVI